MIYKLISIIFFIATVKCFAYSPIINGALLDMNNTSDFRYDYLALTNAIYKKSFDFVIDRKSGKITEEKFLKQNEYIIFRTRTETNNLGHVIRANYGRIGEDLDHMFGLRIRAWFNPNENDTNLEDARLVP